MREIIFRGLTVATKPEWVVGHYVCLPGGCNQHRIFPIGCSLHGSIAVYGETVGQYTGLLDKNGKRIFEGDIVRWRINGVTETAPVIYDEQCATFWMGKSTVSGVGLVLNDWMRGEYEVIGTIHDKPKEAMEK